MTQKKPKTCLNCGNPFTSKTNSQIYCSVTCKRAYERKTRKSIKAFDDKHLNVFHCSWCGHAFEARHARKYCSKTCLLCANGAKKATRNNASAIELARVNQLARDAGLSYGQYVSREYAKLISHNTKENEK